MDLTGYVEQLRIDLRDAAAVGDDAMAGAAERLTSALDAAVRMALLEAVADAAAEITTALDGPSVEVRLRGRDPDFVVTPAAPTEPVLPPPTVPDADADDDATTARITLRLPEPLKQRAESAAAATRQSLNTWLVDAVRAAADGPPRPERPPRRGGKQLSGWAR